MKEIIGRGMDLQLLPGHSWILCYRSRRPKGPLDLSGLVVGGQTAYRWVCWFDMTPLAGNPDRGVNPDIPLEGLLLVPCFLRPRGLVNPEQRC